MKRTHQDHRTRAIAHEYAQSGAARQSNKPLMSEWAYVTVTMSSTDGIQTQHQLWKNKKTGELRWYPL